MLRSLRSKRLEARGRRKPLYLFLIASDFSENRFALFGPMLYTKSGLMLGALSIHPGTGRFFSRKKAGLKSFD